MVAQAGCHKWGSRKAKRALCFLLGHQLHVFFYRSIGFKVFRFSKMIRLLFEGFLHHHNRRDTRSFLLGLIFCSNPSSCQNIQRYNFHFPSQLSDSSQACQGASNQCELVSWRKMILRVVDADEHKQWSFNQKEVKIESAEAG